MFKSILKVTHRSIHLLLRIVFFGYMSAIIVSCHDNRSNIPYAQLESLNSACDSTDIFSAMDEAEINEIKKKLSTVEDSDTLKWRYLIMISNRYRQNQTDSAMQYSTQAILHAEKYNDPRRLFLSHLSLIDALSAGGFFAAAERKFDSIKPSEVPMDQKSRFWLTGRRLYSGIYDYVEGSPHFSEYYRRKYVESDDSLLRFLPEGDNVAEFIMCERLVATGRNEEAIVRLQRLLAKMNMHDRLFGLSAYQLAKACRNEGQIMRCGEFMAMAAESDVRRNIREGLAMPALASWLYSQGEFSEAFKYINLSMVDANAGNARTRAARISKLVPIIDEAYRNEINVARMRLILSIVIVSFLLLVLAVMIFPIFRELRRRRRDKAQLTAISRLKDQYIGSIIELCFNYSDKYESLQKLVDRKISSGQANELLKIVKSGKLSEEENVGLYKIIDPILLNIYPDFVEKVNALLRPEERVDPKSIKSALTPELRICFFMSLGVSETNKIARVLNYSVNTVYTYKNRLRSKAIDRDTFDDAVMEIHSRE